VRVRGIARCVAAVLHVEDTGLHLLDALAAVEALAHLCSDCSDKPPTGAEAVAQVLTGVLLSSILEHRCPDQLFGGIPIAACAELFLLQP
jgi:hypothetical protein